MTHMAMVTDTAVMATADTGTDTATTAITTITTTI